MHRELGKEQPVERFVDQPEAHERAVHETPGCRVPPQTMVRAATLRKNGTVRSASVIARIGADWVPLANQRAKGSATSSSIAVTVAAMRSVRSVTDQRPDSKD